MFWKYPRGNIYELHNLLQNLHPKIKFTMEHSFKELPFLDILIKTKITKSSQISATSRQTAKITPTSIVTTRKTVQNPSLPLKSSEKLSIKSYTQPSTREVPNNIDK